MRIRVLMKHSEEEERTQKAIFDAIHKTNADPYVYELN